MGYGQDPFFLSILQIYGLRNELGTLSIAQDAHISFTNHMCSYSIPSLSDHITVLLKHIGEFRMVASSWRDLGKAYAAMWFD